MDKATPTPSPASVDSFMSLLRNHENRISETYGVLQDRRIPSEEVRAAIDASSEARNALIAEVERLAAQAAPTEETRCACNDRPATGCPGEWEPGCDLGNNPKYVRAGQSPAMAKD